MGQPNPRTNLPGIRNMSCTSSFMNDFTFSHNCREEATQKTYTSDPSRPATAPRWSRHCLVPGTQPTHGSTQPTDNSAVSYPEYAGGGRSYDGLADQPEVPLDQRAPDLESDGLPGDSAVQTPSDDDAVGGQDGADVDPRSRLPDRAARVERRTSRVTHRHQLYTPATIYMKQHSSNQNT